MSTRYATVLGKTIKSVMKLRGGGSALPGLVVEKIDPNYIKNTLSTLPKGVVVVSGTNGKTTTTKMVVELLEGQGLRVFTNRTGSNFTRGVAAALLGEVDSRGYLAADIAVLELDEAHAVHFVKAVQPRYTLLLNVMRDQLDRFGEIDATAQLLKTVADATTETVVVNREDPRLMSVAAKLKDVNVAYFGLSDSLRSTFPTDDDMRATKEITYSSADVPTLSSLESFDGNDATFIVSGTQLQTPLKLEGIYNIYNAAAALGVVASILPNYDPVKLTDSLANVTPAFGRGETVIVHSQPVDLVLVKNPAGFRLSLKSFSPKEHQTMIAINDNYADGRDMSWLWDVDFDSLQPTGVAMVSGVRAYDMAVRLQYEEVEISHVVPDLAKGLRQFLTSQPSGPKRIYCTYTAMLAIRRELGKMTKVEVIS